MAGEDKDAAQARLLELLTERAGVTSADRRAELDAEIATAGKALGLEAEEVASVTPEVVEAARRPPALLGRFRIMRRARDVIPFYLGVLLAAIVGGMGQPGVAVAVLAGLVVAWVWRSRVRVAVFDIDRAGHLDLHQYGRVEWRLVDELTFGYLYPWLAPEVGITKAANETAVVRIRMHDGRTLRLAQGQLFRIRPGRQPVGLNRLATFLRQQARAAGLRVETLPGGKGRWRATRRPADR